MKRLLQILAWGSGAVGVILMILAVIAVLAGGILFNHWWSNYLYPAGIFLVLGIFLFLGGRELTRIEEKTQIDAD